MSRETDPPAAFCDADVLIAGSFSADSASHLILRLAELGVITAVSSEQVRVEVTRNLLAKLPGGLPTFRVLASAAVQWVADPGADAVEKLTGQADPKDTPILAAAIETGCSSLVTFNVRDYRPKRGTIRIETPGEFIRRLRIVLTKLTE